MSLARPTLLLTRPKTQSERFADQCRAHLGEIPVVISPILKIVATGGPVDVSRFGGVLLTSENGARMLAARTDVRGVRAWCVGDRTAEVATALKMRAVSAAGDADALVNIVTAARPDGVLLHARGAESRGDLANRLNAAGFDVQSHVVYEQRPMAMNDAARAVLGPGGNVILPIFSPRSADLLGKALSDAKARLRIVALSEAVRMAWAGPKAEGFTVAEQPDAPNMIRSIATIWSQPVP